MKMSDINENEDINNMSEEAQIKAVKRSPSLICLALSTLSVGHIVNIINNIIIFWRYILYFKIEENGTETYSDETITFDYQKHTVYVIASDDFEDLAEIARNLVAKLQMAAL